MRRIIAFFSLLVMLACMTLTVFAAEPQLKITDASARPGETVYLTVSLTEGVSGDTMGITYTYDKAVLEVIPSACTWQKKGILKDFGSYDDSGVWTSGKTQDLSGDICVLTFRVKSGVTFTGTDVECTLLVKNGSEQVGEYTATARISAVCDHEYGDWADAGNVGHSRACAHCNGTQTSSHTWNEGDRKPDPENSRYDLLTRTCEICGAARTDRIPAHDEGEAPTLPEATQPPVTEPEVPTISEPTVPVWQVQNPTNPTEPAEPTEPDRTQNNTSNEHRGDSQSQINQNQGGSQSQNNGQSQNNSQSQNNGQSQGGGDTPLVPGNSGTGGDSHDHSGDATEPVEGNFHVHIGPNGEYIIHEGKEHTEEDTQTLPTEDEADQEDHTGHDHADTGNGNRGEGAIAVIAAVAILAGGAYFFLKKKKR